MAEKKIAVVYSGKMSGVEVDHFGGIKLERGKEAEVPAAFAIEKCARRPDEFKLGKAATDADKKAVKAHRDEWKPMRMHEQKLVTMGARTIPKAKKRTTA